MKRSVQTSCALFFLTLLTLGCPGSQEAVISSSVITVSPPNNGAVTVSGARGAVLGGGVNMIVARVYRDAALKQLTGGTGDTSLNADGGFPPITLGNASAPVLSGYYVYLLAMKGIGLSSSSVGSGVSIRVP